MESGVEISNDGKHKEYRMLSIGSVESIKNNLALLISDKELLNTLQIFYKDSDIRDLNLFVTDIHDSQLPASLDWYISKQKIHIEDMTDTLKSNWLLKVYSIFN